MPVFPVPNRCIWCLKPYPEVPFDRSHVLPQSVGNKYQQILPAGVVCQPCNNSYSRKVEREFIHEPLFRMGTHVLGIRKDPHLDSIPFDNTSKHFHFNISLNSTEIKVDCDGPPRLTCKKIYNKRNSSLLSRAIHKMAFERLAHVLYVKGHDEKVDVLSELFHPIRQWVRLGQPMNTVRPVLRGPSEIPNGEWEVRIHENQGAFLVQMKLFAEWFGVHLTAESPESALRTLVMSTDADTRAWILEDKPVSLGACRKRLGLC